MLKNTTRVRNVAHNSIEKILHEIKFNGEIKFKIYLDGVKFIILRNKQNNEISEAFETFISHYNISRYETFYNRCCRLLRYDIIQRL